MGTNTPHDRARGVALAFEAFEHAAWGIAVGAADGVSIEAVNPAFAAMHGYTVAEACALEVAQLFAPESRPGLADAIRIAHETGHHAWGSHHLRKDGSSFPVLVDVTAVKDDAGHVLRRVVNVQDVSAHDVAVAALHESERRYRELMTELQIGVVIQGPRAEVLLSNPKARELLGLTEEQLVGATSFDPSWNVIHDDGSPFPGATLPVPRAIATRAPVRGVVMGVHRPVTNDRVWLLVDAIPAFAPDGSVSQVVCTFADVTARREAEAELRTNEALLKAVTDASTGPILVKDREGRWIFANPAAVAAVGFPGDVIGKTDREIQRDPAFAAHMMDVDRRVMESGTAEYLEETVSDGRVFVASKAPLRGPSGHVVGVVATAQDITERKRAEEQRAKLDARLQQAERLEAIGRLAGGIAHDFNNMLGVILGHTSLILEELGEDHPIHDDIEAIRQVATRSADLTRQLLAFARKQIAVPRVVDLNELVFAEEAALQRLLGEDVRLRVIPGANLWKVRIDPSQLDQILVNLCANAREAIAGAGTLTIETSNTTLGKDEAARHEGALPSDYVRLAVTDDGCGMDEETLAHIFEPFFTKKAFGENAGLGLATVHGVVRQNEGFVAVRSATGRGATFTVHLPRYVAAPDSPRRAHLPPALDGAKETVLVVEDEASVLNLVVRILTRSGYRVLEASRPADAIVLAQHHGGEIDLVLSDLVMPDMNGQELVTALERLCPKMRHLFMSGYTADLIAEHGLVHVGATFIQKPFSPHDLDTKVREVLDRAR